MPATTSRQARFSAHRNAHVSWLAAVAAMSLLAGCGSAALPASDPVSAPSSAAGSPTGIATPSRPAATPPSLAQASPVDTSTWKTFEVFGVGFKHPPEWKVVSQDPDAKQNPYAKWNIVDAEGIPIAEFSADSAEDNSGDATYVRTPLESINVESNMATPTVVLFEHMKSNMPTPDNNQTVSLMLDEAALASARDEQPQLAYFRPRQDVAAMLETTNGFVHNLGFTMQDVSLEDAKKMMDTTGYRHMVAVMLSVEATAQK